MIALLLTAQALACGHEPQPGLHPGAIVGWTTDGRYFAVGLVDVDDEGEASDSLAVLDVRTDRLKVLEGEAVASWKADHPVVPVNEADTCGDAKLIRQIEALGGHPSRQTRKADTNPFVWGRDYLTFGAERSGVRWVHGEFDGADRFTSKLYVAWSPDCRRVGWVTEGLEAAHVVGPYGRADMVFALPVGPLVHIMAHPDAKEAAAPIYDALNGKGFAPHIGPAALKDREATVVYTSAAARAQAEAMAAAVPGGATVEPLTWPTPADIVVAAGRSAVTK